MEEGRIVGLIMGIVIALVILTGCAMTMLTVTLLTLVAI